MGFLTSLSFDQLQRYSRIIQEGIGVRRHCDLLEWMQGEIQHYLPHEIMLAAWGDFGSGAIRHDIISALPGVRTAHLEPEGLSPLLRRPTLTPPARASVTDAQAGTEERAPQGPNRETVPKRRTR